MSIQTTTELPEWENIVRQVSILLDLVPEVNQIRVGIASLDRNLIVLQADVSALKSDTGDVRRRLDRIDWATSSGQLPMRPGSTWVMFAIGMFSLFLMAALLYLVAMRS